MDQKNCWLKDRCNKVDCDRFCIKFFKLDYLFRNSLMTDEQRKYIPLRLDADEADKEAFVQLKDIESNIKAFVEAGKNIYIYSNKPGNGKTSWALRLLSNYFYQIWPTCSLECKGLFINVPRFLLALKDNISTKSDYIAHIKENALDADLIIWDDIGTKTITSFEAEHLLSLIDARINAGKSNIYTSNLGGEDLREVLGDRLNSRVANYSLNIAFKGLDKRGVL